MSLKLMAVLAFCLGFVSCASGPSMAEKSAQSKALAIDPKIPPSLEISGLSSGALVENSSQLFVALKALNVFEKGFRVGVFTNGELLAYKSQAESKTYFQNGIKEGFNTVAFAVVQPDGSFVKSPESFKFMHFFFKKRSEIKNESTQSPIIISSPSGAYAGENRYKIPFDFIFKPQSSIPKVYYSLNGETRELQGWGPHFFQNLNSGLYKLKIWEVDKNGKAIGPESNLEFTIQ